MPKKPGEDELSDWVQEVESVKPLKKKKPLVHKLEHIIVDDFDQLFEKKKETNKEVVPDQKSVNINLQSRKADVVIKNESTERLSGYAPGISPQIQRKLAAGKIEPTRKIDLHGCTLDDAWENLMTFLPEAATRGHKCVLVIHGKGKGYGEAGDMGIIKANIAKWLAGHPQVLGFHTAMPKHGGNGAVYVMLRRAK